jgi:hypothetical protein
MFLWEDHIIPVLSSYHLINYFEGIKLLSPAANDRLATVLGYFSSDFAHD